MLRNPSVHSVPRHLRARQARSHRVRPCLEHLEDRTTPAYTISSAGTVVTVASDGGDASDLSITFDADNDEYTLSDAAIVFNDNASGVVTAGDGTKSVVINGSLLDQFIFNLGDNADVVTVNGTGDKSDLNLGDGDDSVTFAADMAGLTGGKIDGGMGTDSVDYSNYTSSVAVNLGTTNLFTATLDGTQEVPPNASTATGSAFLLQRPDPAGDDPFDISIDVSGITLDQLTMSHLHAAPVGVNGPIFLNLGEPGAFADSWTGLTGSDQISFDLAGKGTNRMIPAANEADLLAGNVYINVHTTNFMAGEIRGQLNPTALAGTATGTGGVVGVENATGGTGDDFIVGDDNANILSGQGGKDLIFGRGEADTLNGDMGNDSLIGGPGGDTANGGADDDEMVWNNGDGSDTFEGGDGTDTFKVTGSDGDTGDEFEITANVARLDFSRVNFGNFTLDIGTTERAEVIGGSGDDMTSVADLTGVMDFTGGQLFGRDGNDAFDLSAQSAAGFTFDVVGGAQNDILIGSNVADNLDGGNGNDMVDGNRGNDTVTLGSGDDFNVWNNGDGSDVIDGGDGSDTQQVNGSTTLGDNFVVAANGTRVNFQRIDGGPGLGAFSLDIGTVETLDLNTLGGDDTADGGGVTDGLISLNFDGGEGNDVLSGGMGGDVILGGNGNDSLSGGPGVDTILGGGGNDTVVGDTGHDSLFGDSNAGTPGTREATGANATDIQSTVDMFRADLGNPVNGAMMDSQGFGRREINWDGVPDAKASPNAFPGDFFNTNSPRGVVFTTGSDMTGTNMFQVSATMASGTPVRFGNVNPTYSTAFGAFSPERLFTPIDSNIVNVQFFVPGTTTPAVVNGFGAVFTDVDDAAGTTVQYFDAAGNLLTTRTALATPGDAGFTFVGVTFDSAVVAKVTITLGGAVLGGNDITQGGPADLVVLDDFIYGEPVALQADGDDTIIWNNGDGSDVIEGGGGMDTQQVNGNTTLGDTFTIAPNTTDVNRLAFMRADGGMGLGPFSLDIGAVETLDLNTLGGDDTIGTTFSAVTAYDIDGGDGTDTLTASQTGATNVILTGPDATGSGTVTADQSQTITFTNIENASAGQAKVPVGQNTNGQIAVGAGDFGGSTVTVRSPDGTVVLTIDNPFTQLEAPNGVRTAFADVTGDGTPDVIIGTGPGAPTQVKIFDGTNGALLTTITPFEAAFTGGVFVAAGDVTGDGKSEIVITPDQGGGPRVRMFNGGDFAQLADFFGIEDPNFRGGARAAFGDINGDGTSDLMVAAGFGGGPRIAMFDGTSLIAAGSMGLLPPKITGDIFVFEQTLRNGVFPALGDITGDGKAEVIAGGGPGGGPRVFAISGADIVNGVQTPVANFFAGDVNNRGGVRVVVKDLNSDPFGDIVTAAGTNATPTVTSYSGANAPTNGTPTVIGMFTPFNPTFAGGVFVG